MSPDVLIVGRVGGSGYRVSGSEEGPLHRGLGVGRVRRAGSVSSGRRAGPGVAGVAPRHPRAPRKR